MASKTNKILTSSLLLSLLAFGGYLAYCILTGVDFNQRFLGVVRGPGKAVWPVFIFLELQLAVVFAAEHLADQPEIFTHWSIYVLSGSIGLFLTIGCKAQGVHADLILGFYIWASDVAYGIGKKLNLANEP